MNEFCSSRELESSRVDVKDGVEGSDVILETIRGDKR